jgi:hypothetical protein
VLCARWAQAPAAEAQFVRRHHWEAGRSMRLLSWIRAIIAWLREARLAWLTLGALVAAVAFPLAAGKSEQQIRLSGLFLQLLGVGTVAWGLRETRRLFRRPTLGELLRTWLVRFPRWRRDIVLSVDPAHIAWVAGSPRVRVWFPMDPNAPPEQQLKALTSNVQHLDQRLTAAETEIETRTAQVEGAVREEQKARSLRDTELSARLEGAQTGGLHISLAGLVWLLAGLLMATLSSEIAGALR